VQVLRMVLDFAAGIDLLPHGLTRSPITGPAGNVEFLAVAGSDRASHGAPVGEAAVDAALAEVPA
jgi:23S rRNA (cytidine1920-2'-O)/16S rRNA (cytidine1409-2'-O)-methyltransferase